MRGNKKITVRDKMQTGYSYELTEPVGKHFHKDFRPDLSPKQMLALGVFGGVYMRDCVKEFPQDWFARAKFAKDTHDKNLNLFKVDASLSLSEWKKKGWISKEDPRGWFQWYCRYYMGRRIVDEDMRQVKRWIMMKRHIGQIRAHCRVGDISCRTRQRQALLHWAYDARKF